MDWSNYQYVIGYGIGQYYEHVKTVTQLNIPFTHLCDVNWEKIGPSKDGIAVISPEQMCELKNAFVIVFSGNPRNYNSMIAVIKKSQCEYAHISQVMSLEYCITGEELKKYDSPYCDKINNLIYFAKDIDDSVKIQFRGSNNTIKIGNDVRIGELSILCGNNSKISIEDGVMIESAKVIATDGQIEIGEDSLLSTNVEIRNTDLHHIFDKETGKRINYAKNITIGKHVWIGTGAFLLGGFEIGNNSVVGARSVSSSAFPGDVIIAGAPARVTREGIRWSKDFTFYFNHDDFGECMAKEALKFD